MRIPGWDVKLACYLDDHERARFRYGSFDCCIFAAGAVRLLTGIDLPLAYTNWQGARRILRRECGLEQAVGRMLAAFNFREIGVLHAQRGDVVIGNVPNPSVGIVSTDGWNVVFAAKQGIVRLPLSLCRLAWRIE